jgi:hypothetical protein
MLLVDHHHVTLNTKAVAASLTDQATAWIGRKATAHNHVEEEAQRSARGYDIQQFSIDRR